MSVIMDNVMVWCDFDFYEDVGWQRNLCTCYYIVRDLQPSASEHYSTFKIHQLWHCYGWTQHQGFVWSHKFQRFFRETARFHGRSQQSSRDPGGVAQLRQYFDRFLQCQGVLRAWKCHKGLCTLETFKWTNKITTEIVGFSSLILSHLVGFHHNKNELPPFNESLRRCVFSRQLGGWHELDSGSSWTKNMSWQNWDPALTIQNSKFKWDKMRWTWDDIVFSHLVSSQYGTKKYPSLSLFITKTVKIESLICQFVWGGRFNHPI